MVTVLSSNSRSVVTVAFYITSSNECILCEIICLSLRRGAPILFVGNIPGVCHASALVLSCKESKCYKKSDFNGDFDLEDNSIRYLEFLASKKSYYINRRSRRHFLTHRSIRTFPTE